MKNSVPCRHGFWEKREAPYRTDHQTPWNAIGASECEAPLMIYIEQEGVLGHLLPPTYCKRGWLDSKSAAALATAQTRKNCMARRSAFIRCYHLARSYLIIRFCPNISKPISSEAIISLQLATAFQYYLPHIGLFVGHHEALQLHWYHVEKHHLVLQALPKAPFSV